MKYLIIILILINNVFAQPTVINTGQYVLDITTTGGAVATQTTDGWNIFSENDHLNLLNIGTNTHVQIDNHIANLSNPHQVTKAQVGLGNVDNTSDLDKPISTDTQTALDLKYDVSNPDNYLNEAAADLLYYSITNPDNFIDQAAADLLYYSITNPSGFLNEASHDALPFDNPHNVNQTQVGLGNVNNTSDLDKPISTATQTALDLKYDASNPDNYLNESAADLLYYSITNPDNYLDQSASDLLYYSISNPSNFLNEASHDALPFDNPHNVNQTQVGLGNVDNTSDLDKPISTTTQTALDLKYDASNPNGYETPVQLDARDTANRDRANHTNTQSIGTITETPTTTGNADRFFVYKVNSTATGYESFQLFEEFEASQNCLVNQTTTYAEFLSLSTNIPATGFYEITWSFSWSLNTAADDFISRLQINGVDAIPEMRTEPKDAAGGGILCDNVAGGAQINTGTNQIIYTTRSVIFNLSAGVTTFDLDFTSSVANLEAAIYNASIRVRRMFE